MKQYMRIIQNVATCMLGAAIVFASCDKSEEDITNYPSTGGGQCMLLPPSISVEPFGGGGVFTRAAAAIEEERQQFNVGQELGNIVTLGNGEAATKNTPPTRANIATGVFYRIVVYKAAEFSAGMKIAEQRLCKAGSTTYLADAGDATTPIYLNYGNYKIFCYSFNKTTSIPRLADGALNIALADGDDFMSTAIIDKAITGNELGTNVSLGAITLYHRCCRLTGTLTAEAFTNNAITGSPALSISGTLTQTGNWAIKSSSFTQGTTAGITKTFTLSGSGASRSGSVIMLPFTNKALKTSYSIKPSSATKVITATNASLSTGTSFSSGGNYSFTIKAIGTYVITSGVESIKIGSYTWATRNCRWNNTFETNLDIWNSGNLRGASLGTTADAGVNSDYNSYFMWGNKSAFVNGGSPGTGSSWPSSQSPCPSGYIVPTPDHFRNLVTYKVAQNKKVSINGETFTINNAYGFYNGNKARGLVLVDGGNVLFLPAAGCRFGTKWDRVGVLGAYWSNTTNGSYKNSCGFDTGGIRPDGIDTPTAGFTIRCVK